MSFNLLCDRLPESIGIDGKEYPVYTDFRNWVKIEILLSEKGGIESLCEAVTLCYKVLPENIGKAAEGIAWFLSAGDVPDTETAHRHSDERIYSFSEDSGYIYSAFLSCYGIDLEKTDMHWWRFRALFLSLENCRFTKITGYRCADMSKVKDKSQKEFLRKMKRRYRLDKPGIDIGSVIQDLF